MNTRASWTRKCINALKTTTEALHLNRLNSASVWLCIDLFPSCGILLFHSQCKTGTLTSQPDTMWPEIINLMFNNRSSMTITHRLGFESHHAWQGQCYPLFTQRTIIIMILASTSAEEDIVCLFLNEWIKKSKYEIHHYYGFLSHNYDLTSHILTVNYYLLSHIYNSLSYILSIFYSHNVYFLSHSWLS